MMRLTKHNEALWDTSVGLKRIKGHLDPSVDLPGISGRDGAYAAQRSRSVAVAGRRHVLSA